MKRRTSKMILVLIAIVLLTGPVLLMAGEKINLNNAELEKLITIKGIGQALAQRIIDYREKNGSFEKIEDIMKVKGISQKKFESIKDAIVVESE